MLNHYHVVRWPVNGMVYLYNRDTNKLIQSDGRNGPVLEMTPTCLSLPAIVLPDYVSLTKKQTDQIIEQETAEDIVLPLYDVRLLSTQRDVLAFWLKIRAQTLESAAKSVASGWLDPSRIRSVVTAPPGAAAWARDDFHQVLEVMKHDPVS